MDNNKERLARERALAMMLAQPQIQQMEVSAEDPVAPIQDGNALAAIAEAKAAQRQPASQEDEVENMSLLKQLILNRPAIPRGFESKKK